MQARGLPSSSATLPEAGFLFSELSSYLKREDVSELQNVYLSAKAAIRASSESGEPYISHPLAVASILANCV
jgi:GTP pyrophosphokinase